MTEIAMRPWCARFQWPGKKPFLVGTVFLPRKTMQHELEAALQAAFDEEWGEILPDHFERPKLIALLPGAIFFVPEKEWPQDLVEA